MIRTRFAAVAALAAVAAVALTACSSGTDPLSSGDQTASSDSIIIGSADFPESQLLATIYAQALNAAGVEATTRLNIGSREVYMPALLDGSINMLPEYTGATLSYLTKGEAGVSSSADVSAALEKALPDGITMLTPSDAQDSDVLAVTHDTADKYNLKTIADLKPYASELVLGGPPEWPTRHEGVQGLQEIYGLNFKDFKALDVGGPLTIAALQNGQIQAADMYSTSPAMSDFVALEDNLNLFPAQNIVPIMAKDKASDKVREVLDKVSAALTTQDLIEMNAKLDAQQSLDDVAAAWISAHDLD